MSSQIETRPLESRGADPIGRRDDVAPPGGDDRLRGAVLVEFALVTLVLYLILAGGVEMGRAVFSAQLLQDVARTAAREIALTRLPATVTFEEAMEDCRVRRKVFDERWLVVDLDKYPEGPILEQVFAEMPIANQMLRPLMIFESPTSAGRKRRFLRYPGALLYSSRVDPCVFEPAEFTVGVPVVVGRRGREGYERIRWVPVLEEIRTDPDNAFSGPFSIISRGTGRSAGASLKRGLVSLRVNYPFQSAMLSGFQSRGETFEPNGKFVIKADDTAVIQENEPPGRFVFAPLPGSFIPEGDPTGPYDGAFGLGRQFALGAAVRPFRKLISAQAVFRREAFE